MDISDNIKKRTSLTAVFYNRSFGFMVVPYAVERNAVSYRNRADNNPSAENFL